MIFKVDIEAKSLTQLNGTTFAENHFLERYDIQEWIDHTPEILGEDLLIIQKEFRIEEWNQRIDLLAVDREANLVVIELKRDHSGSSVDMQSIRYASYISTFSVKRIIEAFAEYLSESDIPSLEQLEDAEQRISEFIGGDFEQLNLKQRIILVAGNFDPEVISVVLWMRDNYQVDFTCIRLQIFADSDNFYLTPTVIIPVAEAESYLKRREEKTREAREIESRYSLKVSDYDDKELKEKLLQTMSRSNKSMTWFVKLTRILLEEDREFSRDELLERFVDMGLFHDLGRAGNGMSVISKIFTNRKYPHIRQVFSFDSSGHTGSIKDNYEISPEYRELMQEVVNQIEALA